MLAPLLAALTQDIAVLPPPAVQGYRITPTDARRRTDMEVGAARVRRITRSPLDTVSCVWILSQSDFATWRLFYNDVLDHGTLWFRYPLALGGDAVTTVRECRFVSTYEAERLPGMMWEVSATLEVRA